MVDDCWCKICVDYEFYCFWVFWVVGYVGDCCVFVDIGYVIVVEDFYEY